eukprot:scaffold131202_cov52-Attheya_sp.AAC.1
MCPVEESCMVYGRPFGSRNIGGCRDAWKAKKVFRLTDCDACGWLLHACLGTEQEQEEEEASSCLVDTLPFFFCSSVTNQGRKRSSLSRLEYGSQARLPL